MKTIFLILTLLLSSSGLANQTEKSRNSSGPLRIQLLNDGTIRLSGQPLGSSSDLKGLKINLQNIFRDRKTQTGSLDQGLPGETIVQAYPGIDFADLLRVLLAVRDSGAKPLDLLIEGRHSSFTVSIPVLVDADEDLSHLAPNPLTLVVAISANGGISLNGDAQDSEKAVVRRVNRLIRDRMKMKAYRSGSNEVEATLFLKADPSVPFSKVIELLRALKRAGANPLGLQIDDLLHEG